VESEVNRELGEEGDAFRTKLRGFRAEARRESARAELEALKQELLSRTLPAAGVPAAAAAG
jgi:hypothetical protein